MNSINFISNRGIKPILGLVVLSLVASLFCDFLSGVFIVLALFALYVFRDTKRYIYENTQSVLSPIDGKVVAIDKKDGKTKVYCKVSLFDNHTVRAPFSGELIVEKYQKGLNLNPDILKAQTLNEQIICNFETDDKSTTLNLKLISGFFNVDIEKLDSKNILQGDEILFFIDGMAVVTVDDNLDLLVNIGDKLVSGQSILYKNS